MDIRDAMEMPEFWCRSLLQRRAFSTNVRESMGGTIPIAPWLKWMEGTEALEFSIEEYVPRQFGSGS
jgi:hypothetical protein